MLLLNPEELRVIVQGITGERGSFHTAQMLDSGTPVVGGVTPGKGGEWASGVPVFDTVRAACEMTGANTSIIFVPQHAAADAIYEALDASVELIVCISDGIPIADMTRIYEVVKNSASRLIGPNCPGILIPDIINLGIFPAQLGKPGHTGIVAKGGALLYEVIDLLTGVDIGQSTCVGIGGDPIVGTSYVDVLEMFEADPQTEAVVLLGEIGGRAEIDAAEYIKRNMTKPVTAFIAGLHAPEGRRMGHAGAIIEGGNGGAQQKIDALREAGVRITQNPDHIPDLLRF